jgi:hypothetical protein
MSLGPVTFHPNMYRYTIRIGALIANGFCPHGRYPIFRFERRAASRPAISIAGLISQCK